ncbi:MAG TPA: hypothetical protein PLI09_24370, partial [Candidatus Hydrogenedentes bacterium]|nr:hypothetical protein [Candidatus Hydrogenedentota bacterium]
MKWKALALTMVVVLTGMGKAGSVPANGINFSVKSGSLGLPGTALSTDVDPENDVYKGSAGINFMRLNKAMLGLAPGDDIDAISYPDASLIVLLGEGGFFDITMTPIVWHFSVDYYAWGTQGSAVNNEVTAGTGIGLAPAPRPCPNPNEAHGDYFYTSFATMNNNLLGGDEEFLGLDITPWNIIPQPRHFNDDLNGLDLQAAPISHLETPLQPGELFFSLAGGAPSLGRMDPNLQIPITESDILTPDGHCGFRIALVADGLAVNGDHTTLGIPMPGNDLDALFVDGADMPFFSVLVLMSSQIHAWASPGDILVPDGMYLPVGAPVVDGIADELIPARKLGLLDGESTPPDAKDDNLDALDAELIPIQAIEPPNPEPDMAGECEGEGEGEGEGASEGEVEGEGILEGETEGEGEGELVRIHDVNITVNQNSQGFPWTDVHANADPENDVFKASGGMNKVRLDKHLLGLLPGDDIDAVSYGLSEITIDPMGGGWEDAQGMPLFWHFSVDPASTGVVGSAVNFEVTTGTSLGIAPLPRPNPLPQEALGDIFVTGSMIGGTGNIGSNMLAADEEWLGLDLRMPPKGVLQPNMYDNLNGLDLLAPPIVHPDTPLMPGELFFSLKAGSPSLGKLDPILLLPISGADILTPDGNGSFRVAAPSDGLLIPGYHTFLGIPADDNDLDALFVDANGIPFFSVTNLIPGVIHQAANPGDVLTIDGLCLPAGAPMTDGVADEFIPARNLGLFDLENIPADPFDDNLDALDVAYGIILPGGELSPGRDIALVPQSCPDDAFYQQLPHGPADAYALYRSSEDANFALDRFSGVQLPIDDVHWWGFTLEDNGWGIYEPCNRSSETYLIEFYQDSKISYSPGYIISQQTVTATREFTGMFYNGLPLWRFDAVLNDSVGLSEGWISIMNTSEASCFFFWLTSASGDGSFYYYNMDGSHTEYNGDLSFCLTTLIFEGQEEGALEGEEEGVIEGEEEGVIEGQEEGVIEGQLEGEEEGEEEGQEEGQEEGVVEGQEEG